MKIFSKAHPICVRNSVPSHSAFCSFNPENLPCKGAAAPQGFHWDFRNCTCQKSKKQAFTCDLRSYFCWLHSCPNMPFSLWEAVTASTRHVLITFWVEFRTKAAKCFGNNLHILRHIHEHVQQREQAFSSLESQYTRELFLLGSFLEHLCGPSWPGYSLSRSCRDPKGLHIMGLDCNCNCRELVTNKKVIYVLQVTLRYHPSIAKLIGFQQFHLKKKKPKQQTNNLEVDGPRVRPTYLLCSVWQS